MRHEDRSKILEAKSMINEIISDLVSMLQEEISCLELTIADRDELIVKMEDESLEDDNKITILEEEIRVLKNGN